MAGGVHERRIEGRSSEADSPPLCGRPAKPGLLRAGIIKCNRYRSPQRKASKRLRDRAILKAWIRVDKSAAVWGGADRQAVVRASARTPDVHKAELADGPAIVRAGAASGSGLRVIEEEI